MTSIDFVATAGVKNLARDLRRVAGKEASAALRKAHREIANEVRDQARSRARTEYGKQGSYGRAARAIQSRAFPDAAKVRLRSGTDPRVFGSEFGSIAYRQFRPWKGNQWTAGAGPKSGVGYALMPTLRDNVPKIRDEYGDRLMDAMAVAFPRS